jgi:endonuclease/exonuclease/phosphatase family metal-dependent hydrolase
MGWNAFNLNSWRGQNVLGKVRSWNPDVFGAQEVEKGGGAGYDEVKDQVVNSTGLGHAGGGQFFNASAVEENETGWVDLISGYWMSMTKYKHKASGEHFLFFNSHWKHGHGMEQAEIIVAAIHDIRRKHGSPPTVLVGDTNQFCRAYEKDAIKYLKGEIGASPVSFVDAIHHDYGRSFGDDCRVDFILASVGQWSWVQSFIERDGMGSDGTASDHAALMAELVPQF